MTHYDFYGVIKSATPVSIADGNLDRTKRVILKPGDTLSHPGSRKESHYIHGPAQVLCVLTAHGSTDVVVNPDAEAWVYVFGYLCDGRAELEKAFAKLPDDPEDDDADEVAMRESLVYGFRRIARTFDEGIQAMDKSLSTGGQLPQRWQR